MFERLRTLRQERGLTCADMAKLLGLKTKAGYSKKELGKTVFSLNEARQVASLFGLCIKDVFFCRKSIIKRYKNQNNIIIPSLISYRINSSPYICRWAVSRAV